VFMILSLLSPYSPRKSSLLFPTGLSNKLLTLGTERLKPIFLLAVLRMLVSVLKMITKLAAAHRFESPCFPRVMVSLSTVTSSHSWHCRQNFELLKSKPRHPSVRLNKVGKVWSAHIGLHYCSLGEDDPGGILWYWIDPHSPYDKLT